MEAAAYFCAHSSVPDDNGHCCTDENQQKIANGKASPDNGPNRRGFYSAARSPWVGSMRARTNQQRFLSAAGARTDMNVVWRLETE